MKEQITLTEKRFFEWHEDDVSVTLRNKGGSYGGGSEVLVITCSGSVQSYDNGERDDDAVLRKTRPTSPSMHNRDT